MSKKGKAKKASSGKPKKGVVPAHLRKFLFKKKGGGASSSGGGSTTAKPKKTSTKSKAKTSRKSRGGTAKKGTSTMSKKGKGSGFNRGRAGAAFTPTLAIIAGGVAGGAGGIASANMLAPKIGEFVAEKTGWDWLTTDAGQFTLKVGMGVGMAFGIGIAAVAARRRSKTLSNILAGVAIGFAGGGVGEPVVGYVNTLRTEAKAKKETASGMQALTGADFDRQGVAGRIAATA